MEKIPTSYTKNKVLQGSLDASQTTGSDEQEAVIDKSTATMPSTNRNITLCCATFEVKTVFFVEIDRKDHVAALQKAIVKEKRGVNRRFNIDPAQLTLYLACRETNENREWLEYDDKLDELLGQNDNDGQFKFMPPTWLLERRELFDNFDLGKEKIHVLVRLPKSSDSDYDNHIMVDGVAINVSKSRKRNKPALLEYWNTLRRITFTRIDGHEIVQLPTLKMIGGPLYIRRCYPRLWELCFAMLRRIETRHLVILGNPGIGKTHFGLYILICLARMNVTVVYENGPLNICYLFSGDTVIEGSRSDFSDILDQASTYYVVDGIKTDIYAAKTILLTLPDRSIWYTFSKTNCTVLFMPVWTWEEIQYCATTLYPQLEPEVVQTLFEKWGGIPRYVFNYARDAFHQHELDVAIQVADMKLLSSNIGNLEGRENDISHRLLHYQVNEDFYYDYLVFASPYVLEAVCQKHFQDNMNALVDFLAASKGNKDLGVIRNILFERYAHVVLRRGGIFRLRQLFQRSTNQTTTERDYAIPPAIGEVMFEQLHDLQQCPSGSYLRPLAQNIKSVDAILMPNILFRVTCARKCPVVQSGLNQVLRNIASSQDPMLIFVVPPDIFPVFEYQNYMDATRKIIQKPTFPSVRDLKQYVLQLNLVA